MDIILYLILGIEYWTRRHQQMTRAYVINIPTATATAAAAATPILPN